MEHLEYSKEDVFLDTLKRVLEDEEEHEILKHLEPSKVKFKYTNNFTSKRDQRSAYVEFRVNIASRKALMTKKLSRRLNYYCKDLFEEDEAYGFAGIEISVLLGMTTQSNNERKDIEYYSKNQVYENLITKIKKSNLDPIEERYLFEACNCAKHGQRLAASTMLGCAAEHLLLQLTQAYLKYLENNGTSTATEIIKFRENIIEAKKAHARLIGFKKTVENKEKLFEALGLENSNIHFAYLDVTRQIRNDSGHPTGKIVSDEDLNSLFAQYQHLIDRVHPLIQHLPTAKPV